MKLSKISRPDDEHLLACFQPYFLEMQKYLPPGNESTKALDAAGILRKYWLNSPNWPYFFLVNDEIAGFCLLRHYPGESQTIDIDQFYVLERFRRQGVGAAALRMLCSLHPGNWLIRVLLANTGALAFWQQAVESVVGSESVCTADDRMSFIRFQTVAGYPPPSD